MSETYLVALRGRDTTGGRHAGGIHTNPYKSSGDTFYTNKDNTGVITGILHQTYPNFIKEILEFGARLAAFLK